MTMDKDQPCENLGTGNALVPYQARSLSAVPREEPAPALYARWRSYLGWQRIDSLAASDREIWAVANGSVVR
jgi:hypothetical protein